MSDQDAIKAINAILDRVYALELSPVNGINEISKALEDLSLAKLYK